MSEPLFSVATKCQTSSTRCILFHQTTESAFKIQNVKPKKANKQEYFEFGEFFLIHEPLSPCVPRTKQYSYTQAFQRG